MNQQTFYRLGCKEKEILKLVASGVLLSVGIVACVAVPGLPAALSPFLKNRSSKNSFKRSIKSLEEKDIIFLSGDKVKISKRGLETLEFLRSDEISINKTKWDKIWRIVSYDIPDKYKNKRDYLRRKLINLGFKNIQKSMWVIPYECREEMAIFAQGLGLAPFVIFMETDHLPKQEQLIRLFKV